MSRKVRKGGARKMSRKVRKGGSRMYGGTHMVGHKGGKGRKMSRKGRKMRGGAQSVLPASVNDSSMKAPSALSLAQGGDYEALHRNQHGGFIAPVGHTGMLPADLQASARVLPTMQSLAAASGMQDGGARRGKKINHRAIMAMLKKLNKKMKSRKQRGGMPYALTQAQDYSTPGMLLSPTAEKAALAGMNPEWKLASDPGAFAPKMA